MTPRTRIMQFWQTCPKSFSTSWFFCSRCEKKARPITFHQNVPRDSLKAVSSSPPELFFARAQKKIVGYPKAMKKPTFENFNFSKKNTYEVLECSCDSLHEEFRKKFELFSLHVRKSCKRNHFFKKMTPHKMSPSTNRTQIFEIYPKILPESCKTCPQLSKKAINKNTNFLKILIDFKKIPTVN